jgi:hypothetical protein
MKLGNGLWETRDYMPPDSLISTTHKFGTAEGTGDKLQLDYYFLDVIHSEIENNGNVMR